MKTLTTNNNTAQGSAKSKILNSSKTIIFLLAVCFNATAFSQKIAAGWSHSFYLCNNGSTTNSWGANAFGQLGNGTINTTPNSTPGVVNGLTGVKAIRGGYQHSLALRNDSTLWTWGDNTDGQLGNGTNINSTTPVKVSGLTKVIAMSGGQAGYHSLALKSDGTVWTWGRNTEGQLGDATLISRNAPVQVTGLSDIVAIAGGEYHSLAIKKDGTVWAWGRNSNGQLGDSTIINRSTPVQVKGLTGIKAIAGGRYFSFAIKGDSTVVTWGQNGDGQLGNGTTTQSLVPVAVTGLTKVIAIAGSAFHCLALKSDGTIRSWGRGMDGQLGDGLGNTSATTTPVMVAGLTNVVAIVSGTNYSMALKANDSLFAWGRNVFGYLGDGTILQRNKPVPVLGLCPTVKASIVNNKISAGWSHCLYICGDSAVNAWGANAFGQVGDGTLTDNNLPVVVKNTKDIKSVAAGYQHSLVLKKDGTLWAWGDNTDGQIGDGSNTGRTAAVKVSGLSDVIAISGGTAGYHSLALKNDGTVWAWGRNTDGQLGDGTTANKNVPTQVPGLKDIIAIAGGEYHSLAIKNDGTVWAWGKNSKGQLGNGASVNSNVPVQVSGLTGIRAIAAGRFFSIALRNDSTVWTWGENLYGQLGNNTTVDSYTPVQVIGLKDATAIAGAAFHCLVIKSDKTLLSWGRNTYGNLGYGTTIASSVPVLISNFTNVVAISGGTNYSIAMKANDSLFAFGRNTNGQLGDGTTADKYSPKAVLSLCKAPVGIKENSAFNQFSVYPNPSSNGKFYLNTNNQIGQDITADTENIEIYNVLGERIFLANEIVSNEIDISNQPDGIYFIAIKTGANTYYQKLVKQ